MPREAACDVDAGVAGMPTGMLTCWRLRDSAVRFIGVASHRFEAGVARRYRSDGCCRW